MKIVIAGDWRSKLYEETLLLAFRKLGHAALRFSWHERFLPTRRNPLLRAAETFLKKAQNKVIAGPIVDAINSDLEALVLKEKPELLFVYRGTHIYPKTLVRIKKALPGLILVGYNNDDPFDRRHSVFLWRHFMPGIPHYDLMLAFRHSNLPQFRAAGAPRAELLRAWFAGWNNFPQELSPEERKRFGCDAVFVGHYEPDGRLQHLEEVARAGFSLRVFGPPWEWNAPVSASPVLKHLVPLSMVWEGDYNRVLCSAKVALCFLSKLNNDTYTQRCFEIPASGTMLMSEYTEDLATLFTEGEEAEFFRSPAELAAKLKIYLSDESRRRAVVEKGRQRVLRDGHDAISRAKMILGWAREIKGVS